MLEFAQGDKGLSMRGVVRLDQEPVDISLYTLTGSLIYQDGTRVAVVPAFTSDGTDGELSYAGELQEDVPVGLNHYQFFATSALGTIRLSTAKIPFRVLPNA